MSRRQVLSELLVSRGVVGRLGPTNTGKTHHAIRRMLGYRSGMMGLPLRLLAREVYDRVVAEVGPGAVALITGEEKRVPEGARYWICTVESMPLEVPVSFLAVDEVQLATDRVRGHVFTDRILRARGTVETWFMGSASMAPILSELVPEVRIVEQPRLSTLSYAGPCRIERLPKRSAVVAFSAQDVYELAGRLRGRHGGVAVVMGSLSPRARNAQVAMYQSGEVPFLVATDAIGMGLNMDVHHVALAALVKFDGVKVRDLRPEEVGQIAGRAGRWRRDGRFGETAGCPALPPDVVEAVVSHRYPPVRWVWWRQPSLCFDDADALLASLNSDPPGSSALRRAEDGPDLQVLRRLLAREDVRERLGSEARLRALWEVCGIPDFGNVLPEHHAELLSWVFRRILERPQGLSDDDLALQVDRLDRIEGDAPTLMARLAGIRTWAFLTHRTGWVEDASGWRERIEGVEERLSDALHAALIARFVDRRGRAWVQAVARGDLPDVTVSEDGTVRTVDHIVGTLRGLRFQAAATAVPDGARRSQIDRLVRPLVMARLEALCADPESLTLTSDGQVCWEGEAVGRLVAGEDWRWPRVRPMRTGLLEGDARGRLAQALERWRQAWWRDRVAPLSRVQAMSSAGRGLLAALEAHLGVVRREEVADLLEQVGAREVAWLRGQGVRVGRAWVWHVALMAQAGERAMLWRLHRPETPLWSGPGPSEMRWGKEGAARVGLERYRGRWVRADVAEAAWEDPRRAERIFGFPAGALGDSASLRP